MRRRPFISFSALGFAIATVAASNAGAQSRSQIVICRDGTQTSTNDARACYGHRGVDERATNRARYDERRVSDDRYSRREDRDDRRDDRNNNANDPRYDNRNGNTYDPRYDRNGNNNDPRYNNRGGYNNNYGGRNAVYEWQGRVDDEVQFQIRGDRAVERLVGRNEVREGRGRIVNGLPQQQGTLVVERLQGRGSVDVIEQPSARNGYTATVRIRDSQGGADSYRFVAYWQPSGQSYDRYGRRY